MKVIHISNFFAEFRGAFIDQLEELGKKLTLQGDEIVYIFPENARALEWYKDLKNKYKVFHVSEINRKNEKKVIQELKLIFKQEKPDIIHSHFDGYDIAITKASSKNSRKIYHRHNEFDISNLPVYKKIYASLCIFNKMRFLKNKGISIFISEEIMQKFINKGYVSERNAIVILNGIATRALDNKSVINRNYDKPVIFALLANYHRKGGDILYEAIKDINKSDINVYLASIFSKTTLDEIQKEFGQLPKWIVPLKISNNIVEYYSMADIFVSSSRKETFSYALAEAIYCKLPCISSDIYGVQWAKKFKTVDFFESENVKELEEKIKYKIDNKDIKEDLEKSKSVIKKEYSESVWCNNINNLYKDIINKTI